MGNRRSGPALRQIHQLFTVGTAAGLTDAELLARFAARRDEAAFEVIVTRHGPMVLGVSRGILGDRDDAEDVFQATFLVLARKAGSLWVGDSLGSWLYRVASRLAVRSHAEAARRKRLERRTAETRRADDPGPADPELTRALREEVDRLPEKYRAAVLLCHYAGMSHEGAARQLRCPVGTVSGRLSRARALLRSRLTRRGTVLPAGFLAASLVPNSTLAAVPTPLAASIVVASVTAAAGGSVPTGMVSAKASLMAERVLMMLAFRWKVAAALLVTVGAAAAGAGSSRLTPLASAQDGPDRGARADVAPKAAEPQGRDGDELRGTWKMTKAEESNAAQENGGVYLMREQLRLVPVPDGPADRIEWSFAGGVLVLKDDDERVEASYRLDPAKVPKRIDLSFPRLDGGKDAAFGIYTLKGDELTCCFGMPTPDPDRGRLSRPSEFETKSGTGLRVYTLRRVAEPSKPRVGDAPPAPAASGDAAGRPAPGPRVDQALAGIVPGKVVASAPVTKDCMILSYIPDWSHGEVDHIGVANNGGGVRTLLRWDGPLDRDGGPPDRRFLVALYSRKTTAADPAGPLHAFLVQEDWPESTAWQSQPGYDPEPAATYKFEPGDGWKLFDVTAAVRSRSKTGGSGHGLLLRFLSEDRSGQRKAWSGYQFVSREGVGEWADRRPVLLTVDPAK